MDLFCAGAGDFTFGGGVLIAVVSVDLMEMAFTGGGPIAAILGILLGAAVFSAINWFLARHGARNRKRCGGCVEQPSEADHKGSGLAIAVGALLDGIPESMVIGLSLSGGGKIGFALIVGFFLSNVPQGLSSASGMKVAGRSRRYIFSVWIGIPLISSLAAAGGNLALGFAGPVVPAAILAFAAGCVLAMLAETMILPGFGFSGPTKSPGWDTRRMPKAFVGLKVRHSGR
ncbi:MAG: ZIP family zinc transporter [Pyrinomonadaceae bacterium]|nr:ZIP family zinc transporter [Pyrinomonadaceae bacterium]